MLHAHTNLSSCYLYSVRRIHSVLRLPPTPLLSFPLESSYQHALRPCCFYLPYLHHNLSDGVLVLRRASTLLTSRRLCLVLHYP